MATQAELQAQFDSAKAAFAAGGSKAGPTLDAFNAAFKNLSAYQAPATTGGGFVAPATITPQAPAANATPLTAANPNAPQPAPTPALAAVISSNLERDQAYTNANPNSEAAARVLANTRAYDAEYAKFYTNGRNGPTKQEADEINARLNASNAAITSSYARPPVPGMGGNNPPPGPLPWQAPTTAPQRTEAFAPGGGFVAPPMENASVQDQLARFLASNSPVMQQARTGAMQYANSRGLLNSSIAAGAGEDAVIRSAVPIASQDAAQINARNLANLGFGFDTSLQNARLGSAEYISAADIAARAALQQGQIASTERLSAADIAARAALQQGQIGSNERLSAREIASQQLIETNRLTANLGSSDRQAVTSAVERAFSDYTSKITSLTANNEVPAESRTEYMRAYAAERDRAIALIESVYNVDLPWTSVTGG